jgi:peptidyl-dipeptidase A
MERVLLGAWLLLTGCVGAGPAGQGAARPPAVGPSAALASEARLTRRVDELEARVAPRVRELNQAFWDEAIGVERSGPRGPELELSVRRLYAEPGLAEEFAAGLEVGSTRLTRRLALHLADLRENQAPWELLELLARRTAELERRFFGLRFLLDGEEVVENDLYAILQEERDEGYRRAAWESLLARGAAVRDELLELVRLRNEVARAAGFEDFYAMRLASSEHTPATLESLFAELARRTEPAFRQELGAMRAELGWRRALPGSRVQPWHFEDPFFARAPRAGRPGLEAHFVRAAPSELALAGLERLGFEGRRFLARADLEERPGKRFGAFCLDLDRRGDIRVLASPRPGRAWTAILLHELGHAAYRASLDPELPWGLRQPAHPVVSEAVAVLMGRLVDDPIWLREVAGVSEPELRRRGEELRRHARREALVAVRFGLLVAAFERELYGAPDGELNARWRELRLRLLGERAPEGRDAPDWAALAHLVVAPASYQDYVLAELLASQLEAWLEREASREGAGPGWWSPTSGARLRDRLLSVGASRPWAQLVEEVTGAPLGIEAFARQFELGGAEFTAPEAAGP